MKLKKVLALVLCLSMVLATVGVPVMAQDDASDNPIARFYLKNDKQALQVNFKRNVDVSKGLKVEVYSDICVDKPANVTDSDVIAYAEQLGIPVRQLIGTTEFNMEKIGDVPNGIQDISMRFDNGDEYWKTVWVEDGKYLSEAYMPTDIVVILGEGTADEVRYTFDEFTVGDIPFYSEYGPVLHERHWDAVPAIKDVPMPTSTITNVDITEDMPDLTFALKFAADEATNDQLRKYWDWYADFELTLNKDAVFNADGNADGYLAGSYEAIFDGAWLSVPFSDVTVNAGETFRIMDYAAGLLGQSGLKFRYFEVYGFVKEFNCGVFFDEEFKAANPDLKVSLSLKLYDNEYKDGYNDGAVVGDEFNFEVVTADSVTLFGENSDPVLYSEFKTGGQYKHFDFENNEYCVKYFDKDGELLAQTVISKDTVDGVYDVAGVWANISTKLNGSADDVETTWFVTPNAQQRPAYAEVYVNGIYNSTCTRVTYYYGERALTDEAWAATKGVVGFAATPYLESNDEGVALKMALDNVSAESSLVVKYYSGETLLAESEYVGDYGQDSSLYAMRAAAPTEVITTIFGEEHPDWKTTWYVRPSADLVPDSVEVLVNGKKALISDEVAFMNASGNLEDLTDEIWASTNGVAGNSAEKINIEFAPVTGTEGLYDIILKSADEDDIYEFVGAEFTFTNTSDTYANEYMEYAVLGIDGVTNAEKSIQKKDTYALRLVDGAERLTSTGGKDGDGIKIGQVTFYGQGTINFTVKSGKVVATLQGTHLGDYYTLDEDANTEDTLAVSKPITNGTVTEQVRDVVVNIAFNHPLRAESDKWWDDDMFTVTIKDGFDTEAEYEKDTVNPANIVISADGKSGLYTFKNVKMGKLTITVEAPGYRKYVHSTTLEPGDEALVLNFWNDVKRTVEVPVEIGKTPMTHNFLAGDIVMDYKVDEYDLAAVTSYYGTYNIPVALADKYIKYDLNRDGAIDIMDVHYVLHTLNN